MFLILFLLLPTIVFADVYVVYNPSNDEVYSLSNQDDAVVPSGYEKKTVKGNVEDYYAQSDAKDFKFKGNKIILNAKKITDREKQKEDRLAERKSKEDSAIAKLKAVGLTDDEINILLNRR